MAQNAILENRHNPELLEELYQRSPQEFEKQLQEALALCSNSETLMVWNARLSYSPSNAPHTLSLSLLILFCVVASVLVKMPSFLPIAQQWFYPRFAPLIGLSALALYFLVTNEWTKQLRTKVLGGVLLCSLYLLLLPNKPESASIIMALIHVPLFVLSLLAISFMGERWQEVEARLNFIRYIGEMAIYSVLILLGGVVLTFITVGLFSLIGLSIQQWYMENIVVAGVVSAPIVATYLFDSIQKRQSKFAAMLSNVFSPLFLLTVLLYLVASAYQGKSPYTDRNFLIIINGLLLMILALSIFSISGKRRASGVVLSDFINASLIAATLVVNIIALSAILFRLAEYGLTVNRVVVTGANVVIFIHLILLAKQYVSHLRGGNGLAGLEITVVRYLPIYALWSVIVAVILPLLFRYQ